MRKVIITKGLPGSGKTKWTNELVEKYPGRYKNICKDDLRAMFDFSHYTKGNENFVLRIRNNLITESLNSGYHVIISDTNLDPKHESDIKSLVKAYNIENKCQIPVVIEDFTNVDIDICIKRDTNRPNSVGEKVIRFMYNKWLKPRPKYNPPKHNLSLPYCYIFDMDGTLAIHNDRGPYEEERCDEDSMNIEVGRILKTLAPFSKIVIVSARTQAARLKTKQWLNKNGLRFNCLFMRKIGDNRRDVVVKKEIYDTMIKSNYNVLGVFDDRNSVVNMWREEGLTCFQVAEGDF